MYRFGATRLIRVELPLPLRAEGLSQNEGRPGRRCGIIRDLGSKLVGSQQSPVSKSGPSRAWIWEAKRRA